MTSDPPVINNVSAISVCDDGLNDGIELFNLESQTNDILGAQDPAAYEVTYHDSQADAIADIDALVSPYPNTSSPQGIWVRVETIGDATCFSVSPTALFDIIVLPREDATFTMTPTCDGATVDLPLVTPGGVFGFTGFPGPGVNIDSVTGEVTGATSGLPYEVQYTTPGLCSSTSVVTFTVLTQDDASFDVSEGCDGGTMNVTGTAGGTFSFNPVPTDSAVIDANTGEVTMATPGASYTIEYTTNGACPATNTELLVVNTLDDPSFDLIATCDGATTDNIATPGGTFTFNPDPSDGAVIDTNTGTIANGISGNTYSVEYTTNGVCPQSLIQSVTVTAEDNATFTVAPTCDGGIATLDPAATVGGVFSFDVAPADAAVIDPVTGEVTGGTPSTTYTITYTTTGVCATASTVSFTSDPIDDASFTVNPTCDGGIAVFGVTTILGGTFSFDTAPTDTAVIDPNTGLVSNGTPGETYSIEYVTNGICPNSSVVTFTANPLPVVVPPTALEVCDDALPDGLTSIDLSLKDSEITGNNAAYSVSYHPTQQDAIDGTNAHPIPYDNIANPETVYIRVLDTATGCFDATQTLELVVEQAPVPLTATPDALRYCDPDSDGFGFFTLTDSEAQITGGDPGLTVTYHETLVNAENNADPIDTSTVYANINEDMQTVYVRLESSTIATDCYTIVQLDLIVEPTPQLVVPEDLEACDDISADGLAQFDLTSVEDEVLDGQDPTDLMFSYYEDPMDAEDGINSIASPMAYTNTVADGQPVWVRVDDTGTVAGCYTIVQLDLIVNPLPVLTAPSPLELCDDNAPGDEQEGFILELANDEILSGQLGIALSYHPTQQDAIDGTGVLTSPYTNTANPQTIFVRGENAFGCVAYTTLTLRVLPIPTPTPSDEIPAMALCDATVVNDGLEVFDLTENEILILNGETGVTPTYHTSDEDALTGDNAIADPMNYTNAGTGGPETIYVRVTNDTTGCFTVVNFTITVNPLPSVVAVTDFIQCELNTDGFDVFDLTTKDSEVLAGQDPLQFAVSYHSSLIDAEGGANALASPYTNTSNPQEIFVRITDNTTGCWIATQRFDIEVQESAQANPDMEPILYEACDDNVEDDGDPSDDSVQFDLSTMDTQVLDGQNPMGYTVTYFANEVDANLNANPLPTLYENITNPQEIYVRVDNDILEVVSINLDLGALPDPLDLDGDGTDDTIDTDGDGIFDLIDVDGDGISDATDTNGDGLIDFVDTDGDGMGDPLDLDGDGTFDNQQDSSICFAVASLTLQVNPLPVFDLDDAYVLCINTNGTEVFDPLMLDTGLSDADYSFEWTFDGNVIAGATGSSYMPLEEGTYGVTVTDTSTSTVTACSISDTTEVMESEPPTLVVVNVTQVFAENHVIEATASGLGVYEYSLDGGPWQESGTFSGVSAGLHEVTARDRNGCGYVTEPIFVVDYPRYFTPNGDGNNDTWNIAGIGGTAKIYIFDRYGKLLKQISPTGAGWDGTYNGSRMPSSDYWFTVEYDEPVSNQRRELSAHFTLKR